MVYSQRKQAIEKLEQFVSNKNKVEQNVRDLILLLQICHNRKINVEDLVERFRQATNGHAIQVNNVNQEINPGQRLLIDQGQHQAQLQVQYQAQQQKQIQEQMQVQYQAQQQKQIQEQMQVQYQAQQMQKQIQDQMQIQAQQHMEFDTISDNMGRMKISKFSA